MSQYRQSPFANLTPVVKNLLIINIIFFVATLVLGDRFDMVRWLSIFYFDSPFFRPWQIITYMFMHGGWGHIFFNMFGLFMFGPILEYSLGSKRFLNFYFVCGIGAILLQMAVQAYEVYHITGAFTVAHAQFQPTPEQYEKLKEIYDTPTLGASGALFGILVAFGVLYPNMELLIFFIPMPIKAKYVITFYVLYEIYDSVFQQPGDNVAHFAHLGGALFGFLLIKLWGIRGSNNFM